jgi:cyclic pyranopterin phosphate synthase
MTEIVDKFGRRFKTLRVSLTQICNLGCVYCVDESNTSDTPASPVTQSLPALTTSSYIEIIATLHGLLKLKTIRITGGEPTLYRDLVPLVEGIKQTGISQIKMTTNGTLLAHKIEALQKAGLTSINVSLDAVDPQVFFKISARRNLQKILQGIDKAIAVGVGVKINCVVMKGLNDSQILPLLKFSIERNIPIRFLELMQMGHLYGNFEQHFFPEREILQIIGEEFDFVEIPREEAATAKYFVMKNGYQFGIISNESDPFCNDCNRLRLDSYGNIFGCLSDNSAINISEIIHNPQEINQRLQQAIAQKKMKFSGSKLSMLAIGG